MVTFGDDILMNYHRLVWTHMERTMTKSKAYNEIYLRMGYVCVIWLRYMHYNVE